MISGISHLTFAVADLERSLDFYCGLLGCTLRARWPEGAYLEAGPLWLGLILDRAAPEATNNSSYSHTAFAICPDTFSCLRAKLLAHNVEEWQLKQAFGHSFYFLDPDGHKLEIHTHTLEQRLQWLEEKPRAGMQLFLDRAPTTICPSI